MLRITICLSLLVWLSSCSKKNNTIDFNELGLGLTISQLDARFPSTIAKDTVIADGHNPKKTRTIVRYYPVTVDDEAGILMVDLLKRVKDDSMISIAYHWYRDRSAEWGYPPVYSKPSINQSKPVTRETFEKIKEAFTDDLGDPLEVRKDKVIWKQWTLGYCGTNNSIRMLWTRAYRYGTCERSWYSSALENAPGIFARKLGTSTTKLMDAGVVVRLPTSRDNDSFTGLQLFENHESAFGIRGRTVYVLEADSLVSVVWSLVDVPPALYTRFEQQMTRLFGVGEKVQQPNTTAMRWLSNNLSHFVGYSHTERSIVLGMTSPAFQSRYEQMLLELAGKLRDPDAELSLD